MGIINQTEIEVRYQETDQMGVVYHANYLVWFEIGRTKFIEELGFKYASLEVEGYLSPVLDIQVKYKRPARYGEKVIVKTWLGAYNGVKTVYCYRVENLNGDILVTGESSHALVVKETFRPVRLKRINAAWHHKYLEQLEGE